MIIRGICRSDTQFLKIHSLLRSSTYTRKLFDIMCIYKMQKEIVAVVVVAVLTVVVVATNLHLCSAVAFNYCATSDLYLQ